MNLNKNTLFILIVCVVIVLGLVWLFTSKENGTSSVEEVEYSSNRGVEGEAIDVALDFYELWLEARQSADTDPFKEGYLDSMAISEEMSARLKEVEGTLGDGMIDPVLCQVSLPDSLRTRPIFKKETDAKFLVLSKDALAGGQAVVTLKAHDGLWEITDITCGSAETAPDTGEYNFDMEGQLLKSVPPPLNPEYWHLVYERDGVYGHTVPLLMDEKTMCITKDGVEEVCSSGMLVENMSVHLQGNMTEAGVSVKRIEFRE